MPGLGLWTGTAAPAISIAAGLWLMEDGSFYLTEDGSFYVLE
jgi:hypothetical protein